MFSGKSLSSIGYCFRCQLPECMHKDNGFIKNEDKYLDSITERQDLCLNMTEMSDYEVKSLIAEGASELNVKLGIGLKMKNL